MREASPNSTPDISTASGADISAGIGAVANAVASIVSTVALAELERLRNPCVLLADSENRLFAAQAGLDKMIAAAQFFAAASQASVQSSIRSWGEAGGNAGGKAFPFWLYDSGAIQHAPEVIGCALFPPACLAAISAGLPANGTTEPSATNSGYRVGPGLYRHPGATGTWRGSTFVAEWQAWKTNQENSVWSPASGRPRWKERLISWCGRSVAGWQTWLPGDPISENSLIGRSMVQVETFRQSVEAARIRCANQEETLRYLATSETNRLNTAVSNQGTLDLSLVELRGEELASEERQSTTFALAGVLGLGLLALVARR